jgi:putative transposase
VGQGESRGAVPEVVVVPGWENVVVVGYRSSNKTVYSARHHLIWCPKYRRRVLVGAVEERLEGILGRVAQEVGAEIIEVEVMPDHVHLPVEIPPPVALSEFMRVAKGCSSRLLRAELAALRRLPCLWSPSWFCSAVGGAPLEVVRVTSRTRRAG